MTDGVDTAAAEAAAASVLKARYPHAAESLSQYVDILMSRGLEWGLMGPREGDKMWQRHVANSVALADAIPHGVEVADVGSGAGLPGIPLALVRPDLRLTLIEPLERRVNFLNLAVEELDLEGQVSVLRERAEETEQHYDMVVCRAVAPLARLLKWTTPLLGRTGSLLALKGTSAEDEVRAAAPVLKKLNLRAEILELAVAPGIASSRAVRVSARASGG